MCVCVATHGAEREREREREREHGVPVHTHTHTERRERRRERQRREERTNVEEEGTGKRKKSYGCFNTGTVKSIPVELYFNFNNFISVVVVCRGMAWNLSRGGFGGTRGGWGAGRSEEELPPPREEDGALGL